MDLMKSLKNSIEKGNISHSYLFEGEKGLGKMALAQEFAKIILCEEGKPEPCNICSSCIKVDSSNHPDLKIVKPIKNIINRETIDKTIEDIAIRPFEANRKIYIIEDCQYLSLESQNILLKTLEEPPEYIIIILITSNKTKILPTILSRCQSIKFYPQSISTVSKTLIEEYQVDENKAKFLGNFTKGSLERSIELLKSEDFFIARDKVIHIIDGLLKGEKTLVFSSMDFFINNKDNIDELLDVFLFWFRDLLIYRETGKTDLLINIDKIEKLSNQLFVDLNKINDIIYKIDDTKINIKRNINFNLTIETMLLSI